MSYNRDNSTCQYVFANPQTSGLTNADTIVVPLPGGLERAPNVMLSLVQCKLLSGTQTSGIVVKMQESPSNYFSADNKGCALGVTDIDYTQAGGAFFHYGLDHDINPVYNIASNTRKLTLFFETTDGNEFAFQDFSTYTFIFKLEYPDQPPAGIVNEYVAEIHRGL